MIECIRFRSHVDGCLQGFADIYSDKTGMEIYGCTLWMKDGRRWVNMPSREYVDADGNKKHSAVNRYREKAHADAWCEEVKKAIDKWCAEQEAEPEKTRDEQFDDSACPF